MMIVPTEHLSKVKQVTLGCPSVGIQLRDGLAKLDTSASVQEVRSDNLIFFVGRSPASCWTGLRREWEVGRDGQYHTLKIFYS